MDGRGLGGEILDGRIWLKRFQENFSTIYFILKWKGTVGVLWSSYFVFKILIECLTEEISL